MSKRNKKITTVDEIPYASDPKPNDYKEVNFSISNKDKYVELYDRWRQFLLSLSEEDKKVVKKWACGDCNKMTPQILDMWARAIKGNLNK